MSEPAVQPPTATEGTSPGGFLIVVGILVAVTAVVLAVIAVNDMSNAGLAEIEPSTTDKIQVAAAVGLVPLALGFLLIGVGRIVNQLHER